MLSLLLTVIALALGGASYLLLQNVFAHIETSGRKIIPPFAEEY